jgi:hypothetical protein
MCPNRVATDWAMHDVDWLAKVKVQKASSSRCSPLSNAQSRKNVCDSISVHAGMNLPAVRAETNLASAHLKNKIHQT